MEIKLTKDADKTLCEIYAAYLERRSSGLSKGSAKDFAEKRDWPDPDWQTPDGEESLRELSHSGMIEMFIMGGFRLTDDAIIYMENRFKNGLSDALEWLGKIKNAIPFV